MRAGRSTDEVVARVQGLLRVLGRALAPIDQAIEEETFENWPWFQITPAAGRAATVGVTSTAWQN